MELASRLARGYKPTVSLGRPSDLFLIILSSPEVLYVNL
jgi:hypothetical protein